jgi:hypothetical protein
MNYIGVEVLSSGGSVDLYLLGIAPCVCCLRHARFLLGSVLDPVDGGYMFLRNVC